MFETKVLRILMFLFFVLGGLVTMAVVAPVLARRAHEGTFITVYLGMWVMAGLAEVLAGLYSLKPPPEQSRVLVR
jgi:hypothetical protein